jgi:uncharacterized protein (DUF885 family)
MKKLCYLLISVVVIPLNAQEWVEESNANSHVLLEVLARYNPESAGRIGIDGYDDAIRDLTPGYRERYKEDLYKTQAGLEEIMSTADEGPVKQDLQIMLAEISENLEELRINEKYFLPYYDAAGFLYNGIRALLEDRIPAERRKAALVRLKKYAGTQQGYIPITQLMIQEMKREWQDTSRLAPFREEVERNLNSSDKYLNEIASLFETYGLNSYKRDYARLKAQVEAYNDFVRNNVLPGSRDDFKLPAEVYAFRLKEYGGDMPVDELQRRAKVAFKELQAQMEILSREIARAREWDYQGYRAMIERLKQEQIDSAGILTLYRTRQAEIERIIERENIVSLPEREMKIRLATAAESAAAPAPFFRAPRLIGNTGEVGEFVLPLTLSGGTDGTAMKIDDFTHEAASWMLAAHEGRPGHELQYASIVEKGVSQARAIFARNSVNSEGWALYMEEQVLPFMPLEGQLMGLWSRAFRASRAILDPGLNLGTISTEEARYWLREQNVASEGITRGELERYRYRAPGQATSYFNGYLRLMELRAETELLLGQAFDKKAFHDFILAQGLLPPALLRDAVLKEFIPAYLEKS